MEEYINELREKDIICPMAYHWEELTGILRKHAGKKKYKHIKIPPPLILGLSECSDYEKQERFFEHIEFTRKSGILDIIKDYLSRTKFFKRH